MRRYYKAKNIFIWINLIHLGEWTIGRTQELPQVKGDSNQDPNHESNLESNEQTLWSPGSSIEE